MANSGVRNLRAMFENKGDDAPPARGISPADSNTSPARLKTVRTSFIAVERNGQFGPQLGLRRENSTDSSVDKSVGSREVSETRQPETSIPVSIPEAPDVDERERGRKMTVAPTSEPTSEPVLTSVSRPVEDVTQEKPKPSPTRTTPKTTIHTKPESSAKKATDAKPTVRKTASKAHLPKMAPAVQGTLAKKPSRAVLSTATQPRATKKPVEVKSTGFVKPKPRSPTRPAKLPASMTAPTTSSLSKTSTAAPPRLSVGSTSTAAVDPTKPRRPATQRPSLGRPSTSERPTSRVSTAPDEGFLARMMRPTASSSHKAKDKVTTPPRKQPGRLPRSSIGPSKESSVAKKSIRAARATDAPLKTIPIIAADEGRTEVDGSQSDKSLIEVPVETAPPSEHEESKAEEIVTDAEPEQVEEKAAEAVVEDEPTTIDNEVAGAEPPALTEEVEEETEHAEIEPTLDVTTESKIPDAATESERDVPATAAVSEETTDAGETAVEETAAGETLPAEETNAKETLPAEETASAGETLPAVETAELPEEELHGSTVDEPENGILVESDKVNVVDGAAADKVEATMELEDV